MCDEKQIATKVCTSCGNELPLSAFHKHGNSKDGYSSVCIACKATKLANAKEGNPKLAQFTPRELIEELRARGYRGKLEYVERHLINV